MNIFKLLEVSGYIIGGTAMAFGTILILIHNFGKENENNKKLIHGAILSTLGMAVLICSRFQVPQLQKEYEQDKKQMEYALEEYTWYLDGNKVDPKTISLSGYRKEINDNSKIVILSRSDGINKRTFLFILLVVYAASIFICKISSLSE